MALAARDRTLDGITANERPQLNDIDEAVGLAAQLIRNHRRSAGMCSASSIAWTAGSTSMFPFTFRRPAAAMNSLVVLVTTL
jgi:hypothetical protein